MRWFVPRPRPVDRIPEGARPLPLKEQPRSTGTPRKLLLWYRGPGDQHLLVPGCGGPDAYVIDTTALRDRDELIEVLAHGFHDLAWKEIARHRRRAGLCSREADRALNLQRANPAAWD